MVRVHCDPPGRKPEWGLPKAKAESRETLKEEKPEREEPLRQKTEERKFRRRKPRKRGRNGRTKVRKGRPRSKKQRDESPEEESFRKKSWPERVKVLPKAEAARRKPPRCEKALKEMEISERGAPIGAKAPSTLTTAQ